MKNIEIKLRVESLAEKHRLALKLGADRRAIYHDTDTYFRVPHGRLKLRVSKGETSGTLIQYERPNESASRISNYSLVTVSDCAALCETLATALGVLATVTKTRELLIYGATRIHLDEVEELGSFVELETVIDQQTMGDAQSEHELVFDALKLDSEQIVPFSYSDLLLGADSDERQRG
jgi:predicted adenylyl cyclase CyaB